MGQADWDRTSGQTAQSIAGSARSRHASCGRQQPAGNLRFEPGQAVDNRKEASP
jgi:hypothetical protein